MKTIINKRNYTVVANDLINDPNISWKAKGLLMYMLSKPEGWRYNVKGDIVKRATDGIDSVYSVIKELVAAKYISRVRRSKGSIDYYIFECCDDNKIIDFLSNHENPDRENPDRENPDRENPDREKPDVLVILNSTNTEYSNTEYSKDEKRKSRFDKNKFIEFVKDHDVDSEIASEFFDYRKSKKAPITPRVVKSLVSEGMKVHMSLSRVFIKMMTRGWIGFEAAWIRSNDINSKDVPQHLPFAQSETEKELIKQGRMVIDDGAAQGEISKPGDPDYLPF